MYDQSPEDSFNISIQNEKAMNKQLNQLEQLQENEFSALERILSENSKLSLSQVEDAINSNSSGKTAKSTFLLNLKRSVGDY